MSTTRKPSQFFKIQFDAQSNAQLNNEQKDFVYLHYVNHTDPEDMVMIIEWLYQQAEQEERQKQEKA